MADSLTSYVLDAGLTELDTRADKIYICSAEPVDYAAVLALAIGVKNFGSPGAAVGSCTAGVPNGRTVTTVAFVDGVVVANGTASKWAIVDSANLRLLARGTLAAAVAGDTTKTFALPAFSINIPNR
jgi:hypothetical protein